MKRGIIVVHDGHASKEDQQHQLNQHVDNVVEITPMTSEDWHFQLADAIKDLGEGDQVVVGQLHYLGASLGSIAHNVEALTARGIGLVVGDQDASDLAKSVSQLIAAENNAARARVAHLKKVAEGRRNATPPKCIFVPVELLED